MAFTYPTAADYTAALAQATGDLQVYASVPVGGGGILSPPIQTHVKALTASLETYTGHDIGSLVSLASNVAQLTQATNPMQVVNAIEGLLWAAEDIAQTVVDVAGIAADAVAIIPIVGQAIGAVLQIIKLFLGVGGQMQAKLDECRRKLREDRNEFCKKLVRTVGDQTAPTSIDPVTGTFPIYGPGDMFRPLAFAYQAGSQQYPPNFTSIMLMLCGGVAGDFGMSEQRYQMIVEQHRKGIAVPIPGASALPARPVGIPMATRLRMWSCIRAIMMSTRHPDLPGVVETDNGQTVMPILMDIVNNEWRALQQGANHGIDEAFVESMAAEAMRWTKKSMRCYHSNLWEKAQSNDPATYTVVSDAGCAKSDRDVVRNMVRQLTSPQDGMIRQYHMQMHKRFEDPATGLWKAGVPGGMPVVAASMSVLREAFAQARRRQRRNNALAAALGLGLGYVAGNYALGRPLLA